MCGIGRKKERRKREREREGDEGGGEQEEKVRETRRMIGGVVESSPQQAGSHGDLISRTA